MVLLLVVVGSTCGGVAGCCREYVVLLVVVGSTCGGVVGCCREYMWWCCWLLCMECM